MNENEIYEMLKATDLTVAELNAKLKRLEELESEKERLIAEKQKVLEYMKTDNYAKLKKEDMYWGYQMGIGMLEHEIDRQKDRIAELEKENATKTNTIADLLNKQEFYEKEKLEQFAERLKAEIPDRATFEYLGYNGVIEVIDETLKEFIE